MRKFKELKMTTLKISEAGIIKFDGEVLEVFPQWRIHIAQLSKFELAVERNGKHTLSIASIFSGKDMPVDENEVPKIIQLVAEVQKAKAEFKFD